MNSTFLTIFKRIIAMMIDLAIVGLLRLLGLEFCRGFMSVFEINILTCILGIIYFSFFESSKKTSNYW